MDGFLIKFYDFDSISFETSIDDIAQLTDC